MTALHLRRPRIFRGPRLPVPIDAPVIRTQRLTLRPHRADDAEEWYTLQSDPRVVRYLLWPIRDRESSFQHLKDRTRHTRLWQRDDFLAFAVELDGRLVGDVSLHLREVAAERRFVEVGWLIDPVYGGHGYATEAAEALLRFAFDVVGARWVLASMSLDNTLSRALASRLGFVEADTTDGELLAILTSADSRPAEARRRYQSHP